ncbi:hypothetical protein T7987_07590 [Sulfitobacter faviae]|uniref:Uncharacterized protein n=1 Tax=Sulfitobacter faviae TaxID=1775881 RepID=A0ABZ0V548_9RHOB|nr:hypothetical protein [Sulfitobacter faviae]WPZ23081.1 hypothetical protein T7987_07590 [Sulfitobacter faviae]
MDNAQKDAYRALAAAKEICDGRHPMEDRATILITLDHVIATILIAAMGNDPKKALAMFNEGVIPSVEERIMLFANKCKSK